MNRIENRYKIQELIPEIIINYLLTINEIRQKTLFKIKNKSNNFVIKTFIKCTINGLYGKFNEKKSICELNINNLKLKQLIINIKLMKKLELIK